MATTEERLEALESGLEMVGLATKEVLTLTEASVFLGLSKSWIYKMTATKQIPHYKPSGKYCYFQRTELEAWAMQNRVSTVDEIEQAAQAYCLKGKGGQHV